MVCKLHRDMSLAILKKERELMNNANHDNNDRVENPPPVRRAPFLIKVCEERKRKALMNANSSRAIERLKTAFFVACNGNKIKCSFESMYRDAYNLVLCKRALELSEVVRNALDEAAWRCQRKFDTLRKAEEAYAEYGVLVCDVCMFYSKTAAMLPENKCDSIESMLVSCWEERNTAKKRWKRLARYGGCLLGKARKYHVIWSEIMYAPPDEDGGRAPSGYLSTLSHFEGLVSNGESGKKRRRECE